MNMISFTLPKDNESMLTFLALKGLSITKIAQSPKVIVTDDDEWIERFHIWYDYEESLVRQEMDELTDDAAMAVEVKKDSTFLMLKNQKQRELYLLSRYQVSSKRAQTIIELTKDELVTILSKPEAT
jgi:hypothetical protein